MLTSCYFFDVVCPSIVELLVDSSPHFRHERQAGLGDAESMPGRLQNVLRTDFLNYKLWLFNFYFYALWNILNKNWISFFYNHMRPKFRIKMKFRVNFWRIEFYLNLCKKKKVGKFLVKYVDSVRVWRFRRQNLSNLDGHYLRYGIWNSYF